MAGQGGDPVVVRSDYGLPYSKGVMALSIMATGLPAARSFELARMIEARLGSAARLEVDLADLRRVSEEVLRSQEGEAEVRRFGQWWALRTLSQPLVVLVGGVTGVGKSTVATQLAVRLGITRVIATDQVRQVLRAFFSDDFMPAVHRSSFDAAFTVPDAEDTESRTVAGFMRQAQDIAPGVDALVERAVSERTQIVIEGVHVTPEVPSPAACAPAITARALLAVNDADAHRSRFDARAAQSPRPARRYLEAFDRIRELQDHLVAQAHAAGTPVIDEVRTDTALRRAVAVVLDAVGSAGTANVHHQEGTE